MTVFTHLARDRVHGNADTAQISNKVADVMSHSDYSSEVTDLPLGRLFWLAESLMADRLRPELDAEVDEACKAQLAVSRERSSGYRTGRA